MLRASLPLLRRASLVRSCGLPYQQSVRSLSETDWKPEERYVDFLSYYCTHNDLKSHAWDGIARKLDTTTDKLLAWVKHIQTKQQLSNETQQSPFIAVEAERKPIQNLLIFDAKNNDFQIGYQIVASTNAKKGICDIYYYENRRGNHKQLASQQLKLNTILLINDCYLFSVLKKISPTHFRCKLMAEVSSPLAKSKKSFFLEKRSFRFINDDNEMQTICNSLIGSKQSHIQHSPYHVPIISGESVIVTSDGHSSIDNNGECAQIDGDRIEKYVRIGEYVRNKNKTKEARKEPILSGIAAIDTFAPFVKRGINLIIIPKQKNNIGNTSQMMRSMMQTMAHRSLQQKSTRVIYADIFNDALDAVRTRFNIHNIGSHFDPVLDQSSVTQSNESFEDLSFEDFFDTFENETHSSSSSSLFEESGLNPLKSGNALTIVAGNTTDNTLSKVQTALTVSTLATNQVGSEHSMVFMPCGSEINDALNQLHIETGALSRSDAPNFQPYSGHNAMDFSKPVGKDHNSPMMADNWLHHWGIDVHKSSSTYVIGLEMDSCEIEDIRVKPSAYFPWAHSVTIINDVQCKQYPFVDVQRSTCQLFYSVDASSDYKNVWYGLRKLFSHGQLLSKIAATKPPYLSQSKVDEIVSHPTLALYRKLHNFMFSATSADADYSFETYHDFIAFMARELSNGIGFDGKPLLTTFNQQTKRQNSTENVSLSENVSHLSVDQIMKFKDFYTGIASKSTDHDRPALRCEQLFNHTGFLTNAHLNCRIKLYTNDSFSHTVDIGSDFYIYINDELVEMQNGSATAEYFQNLSDNKSAALSSNGRLPNKKNAQLLQLFNSIFEQPTNNAKAQGDGGVLGVDPFEKFGLKIYRYLVDTSKNRHHFLIVKGEPKVDISDISVYVFGFDPVDATPFFSHARVSPDSPPVCVSKRPKSKKSKKEPLILLQQQTTLQNGDNMAVRLYDGSEKRTFVPITQTIDMPLPFAHNNGDNKDSGTSELLEQVWECNGDNIVSQTQATDHNSDRMWFERQDCI